MELSKHNIGIKIAYEKGYRVTDDGRLLNPEGKQLSVNPTEKKRYPTFSISSDNVKYYIRAHRFAGYCFFGEETFKDGILVRHLNDDRGDISRNNIRLGTQFDNMADIPEEKQKEMAQKRREFNLKTGKRPPLMNKLTDSQDEEIVKRLLAGESIRSIARDYNVHHSTIQYVKTRKGLYNEGFIKRAR